MSVAKSFAISLLGLAGTLIEIEAEISSNLPSFVLVGLPDASLSESKDRVRAAIQNSSLKMPARRVTVNLSPASVPKQGASFDLSIAVAILAATSEISHHSVRNYIHLGELGLDGSVRSVAGVLPSLLSAKSLGFYRAIVPAANLEEAKLVSGVEVMGVNSLAEVANIHGANLVIQKPEPIVATVSESNFAGKSNLENIDVSDILGQADAIRALTVAAAGGHHLLMVGPPGAGKTMLAERLPTLLPNLPLAEALETTAVLSIADHRRSAVVALNGLVERPPFEAPHHSASVSSLVGGGVGLPRPGLISTANNGVLFLDEAPEFQLPVLEALRQPLESGEVLINRSAGTARFPAKFQLVLAANPCPCGRSFGQARGCTCSEVAKRKYANKLSGPLLDRIDIRLAISAANAGQMALDLEAAQENQMTSKQLRQQVQCARELAAERLSATPWSLNVQVPGSYLRKQLRLASEVTQPIDRALAKGKMSMRGYDRCLRLAWSIADLAGCDQPRREHIVEAAYLRGSDSPMVGF